MLEINLEKKCMTVVESLGGMGIKLNPVNRRGIPDRLILLPGRRVLFVEFKAARKKPRKNQSLWLERLQCLGFTARCIDNRDDFISLINEEMK